MITGLPKTTNRLTNFRRLSRTMLASLLLLTAGCLVSLARVRSETQDPLRYLGGMRNSPEEKKLSSKQLEIVLKSLQEKTGYAEMSFDENGFLRLGDREKFNGGSETARALFETVADSNKSIDLQNHTHSPTVAFARLERATVYQSRATGKTIDVYPLQIDFSDFSKLRGDKRVIAAFDIGFVIMHELGHAILGLRDPASEVEGAGECEDYINRIRRELNLPERQNYIARTRSVPFTTANGNREHAELNFVHLGDAPGLAKPQNFSLLWEASTVGPIRSIKSPAKPSGSMRTAAAY
jgi:hypothetical protein